MSGWMAQQVAQRNPFAEKPIIVLMDGEETLWQAAWVFLPEELGEVTEILDLLHALGYLWEAAHAFHPKRSDAARGFVKKQARRILQCEIAAVIQSLRWPTDEKTRKCIQIDALESRTSSACDIVTLRGEYLHRFCKIGLHWLVRVKNSLSLVFDRDIGKMLASY